MSQLPGQTPSWNVGKASGQCAACGAGMEAGRVCWAALVESPRVAEVAVEAVAAEGDKGKAAEAPAGGVSPFARVDFCEACWGAGRRPEAPREMFSFWKTAVPTPTAKKKLLVDDSVLVDLFSRLEDKDSPQDVRFRFVLALILMRKRLLKYEGAARTEGKPETWTMIPRGENAVATKVVNPELTVEQIGEVSGQLSQILAEEI